MQKTVLFLPILLLLLIFNGCSKNKKQVEILQKSLPCDFVKFVIPKGVKLKDINKNTKDRTLIIISVDWVKKNADSIINISLSEKTNIDSLFIVLDNYKKNLDSLKNEKWIAICLKIPQMPLNTFSKILCQFQRKEINLWALNSNEIIFFFFNKKRPTIDEDDKEYAEYLETLNADNTLGSITEYGGRYKFITSSSKNIRKYLSESDTIINFHWNNNNSSLQPQLDSLDNLISNFKNKYQKTPPEIQFEDTSPMTCNRKAFSIHFAENIPLTEIIKIIDISRKYNLIYEVDCVENRLNICTLCYKDEYPR